MSSAVIAPVDIHNHEHQAMPTHSANFVQADVVLSVRNLSTGYADQLTLQATSFDIRRGERVGILGPNGAGKSTLFKAIMGILPIHSGEILIHGRSATQESMRVAYVPQFEEIDWKFPVSVYDVVMMGRTRHIGWLRRARHGSIHDQLVREALARVGMSAFGNRQIGDLSGGQKRRVFIARALAQEADILLLDEPFAGVDARAQESINTVLDTLSQSGVTILLATHDLGTAQSRFDKLILLNKRMIAFGTPAEVFQPEALATAFGGQMAFWKDGEIMMVADHCCP
ncbi:MAG: metal ABC transporter ATP-binding protein [Anaerolineae bacterium]|nr:metal ABC transporter ATP-binding protein [Anaerolineae bacterium]